MQKREYLRAVVGEIEAGFALPKRLIQVLVGGRQTGKTTVARQVADRWKGPVVRASADAPLPPGPEWVETHWERARREARDTRQASLLVLDEIQKVRGWSETVKALWDDDRAARGAVRPVLLGSSAMLVQQGLTESLAGRFFLHRCPHWSLRECEQAFGWDLDRFIFFGGYPGAAMLASDEDAWRRYVTDSLVETAIARDVLATQKVAKPALLRHLFALAAQHPAEILSYNKMLGTLQDAGNTVTLAHYLRLLETSFLVSGLERMAGAQGRQRGSSPKIVLWNNALVSASSGLSFAQARADRSLWGRLVENAVGAHLLNWLPEPRFAVRYYRDRNDEVDYVVVAGASRTGIEVKSGRADRLEGMAAFRRRFPDARAVLVGRGGVPIDEALATEPAAWAG